MNANVQLIVNKGQFLNIIYVKNVKSLNWAQGCVNQN